MNTTETLENTSTVVTLLISCFGLIPLVKYIWNKTKSFTFKARLQEYLEDNIHPKLTKLERDLIALRYIVNDDSILYIECDKQGRCLRASGSLYDTFSTNELEIVGHGWILLLNEEERPEVFKVWKRTINDDIPFSMKVHTGSDLNNTYILSSHILKDKTKVFGYILIFKGLNELNR